MYSLFCFILIVSQTLGSIFLDILRMPEEFIPGKHHIIILKVTNNQTNTIHPQINLNLPDGWMVITKPNVPTLEKGKTSRLLYTVSVPEKAKYGKEKISIVLSITNKEVIKKQLNIQVKEIHNLETIVYEKPAYLKKGTHFSCKYIITNKGNISEKVVLTSRKGEIVDKSNVIIPIDSSVIVTVKQKIPEVATFPQIVVNDLSVRLTKIDTTFTKNVSITAYPNSEKRQDIYNIYPVEGSFLYNIFDNNKRKIEALQYNIKGKGFIDAKEKHFVEFISKGTNKPELIRFENFSEHRVRYIYENNDITIGDFTLNLSRLLENIRLGRGLIYKRKVGRLEVSTFYSSLRFLPTVKEQIGASFKYKFDNDFTFLKLNGIRRNYSNDGGNSFATSLTGSYKNDHSYVIGEYALSFRNSKTGIGAFINGYYKKRKLRLQGDLLYTEADFEGFFNNSLSISTTTSYLLNKKFLLNMGINYNFINPKQDVILTRSFPFYQNYSLGIRYLKNKDIHHRLSYNYRSNKDRSNLQRFDYQENTLTYTNEITIKNFNFRFNNSLSSTTNRLSNTNRESGTSLESSFFGSYKYSKNFKIGSNIEYLKTNRYSNKSTQFLYYGGYISYLTKNKFQLNASYRNNYPLEEFNSTNSLLNLDVIYTINADHSLSISGRYNKSSQLTSDKDLYFLFKYNVRLGIPVKKNKNLGKLLGKINLPNQKVNEGIQVHLNALSTITDEEGIFEFNNVPSGKYFLTLEKSKSVSEYIVQQQLPLKVEVVAKQTTDIFIDMIKPAKINGKIIFKQNKQIQSNVFKNQMPKFIIKLQNDKEDIFYTLINDKGEFSFNEIKPGNWLITLITKGFEKIFEFPKKTQQLNLTNGKNMFVDFIVKAKSRKISIKKNKIILTPKS
jgi:hypothetical protein